MQYLWAPFLSQCRLAQNKANINFIFGINIPETLNFYPRTQALRCYKDLIPDYLDVFEKRAKTSRNGVVLVVPKRSSKLGRDAFDYQGAVLWNKLPKWIREQNGVDQFQSALKTFLFREHFYS